MTKRIVIHAGFFKTGTTALQSSLAANREKLLQNGVLYPALSSGNADRSTGQHRAAWAIKGRHWGWEGQGGNETPIKVAPRFKACPRGNMSPRDFTDFAIIHGHG